MADQDVKQMIAVTNATFRKNRTPEYFALFNEAGQLLDIDRINSAIDADYVHTVQSVSKAGNYTLELENLGYTVEFTASATCTVPKNSVVPFPLGAVVEICNMGTGTVLIAPVDGTVTLLGAAGVLNIGVQYTSAVIRQRAIDEWVVIGALS